MPGYEGCPFKYERFYEYFVGIFLSKSLEEKHVWIQRYRDWIERLEDFPYLWGAIKVCLGQHIQSLSIQECSSLCIGLAQFRNPRMEEIVSVVLYEYGVDFPEKAQPILQNMLNKQRGFRGVLSSLLKQEEISHQCPIYKRIAITVASNLFFGKLIEYALIDPSPAVRAVSIRHAFIYWKRQRKEGFEVLQSLANSMKGISFFAALQSAIGLSVLILLDDFHSKSSIQRLQTIWRDKIRQFLIVNPDRPGSQYEQIKGDLRTIVLRFGAYVVVKRAKEIPSQNPQTIPELRLFFKRDENLEKRKTIIREITQYLDAQNTDIRNLKETLLHLANERDILTAIIVIIMLKRHASRYPNRTLPIIREMFYRTIDANSPGPFGIMVPSRSIFMQDHFVDRELYLEMVTTYLERFQGKWWSNLQMRRYNYIDSICFAENDSVDDTSLTPSAKKIIETMIENQDYAWMKDVIELELTSHAIEVGNIKFTFSTLEMLINIDDSSVKNAIVELLARMYIYYPDEVDNFMYIQGLDKIFITQVHTHIVSESLGDIIDYKLIMFYEKIFQSSESQIFWQRFTWVLKQIPECKSLDEWAVIIFKFFVNEIYGDKVFIDIPL